jgi:hypothetical protein
MRVGSYVYVQINYQEGVWPVYTNIWHRAKVLHTVPETDGVFAFDIAFRPDDATSYGWWHKGTYTRDLDAERPQKEKKKWRKGEKCFFRRFPRVQDGDAVHIWVEGTVERVREDGHCNIFTHIWDDRVEEVVEKTFYKIPCFQMRPRK